MSTDIQTLLDARKAELGQVRQRQDELRADILALERLLRLLSPSDHPAPASLKPTREELRAIREKQIIALFREREGMLHLDTIMLALGLSRNAAKDWMNLPIDQAPEACPWERLDGNKSRFVLKEYGPRQVGSDTGTAGGEKAA